MQISNDLLIPCPNCGVTPQPKAGFQEGLQRFFCRKCDIHYTAKTPKLLKRHYWHSKEAKEFVCQLYIKGYYPKVIIQEFKLKYGRDLHKESLHHWVHDAGIKPKFRSYQRHFESMVKLCPRCGYDGKVLRKGFLTSGKQRYECRQCGTQFTDARVLGEAIYPESCKDLAVNLYISEPSRSLNEAAKILNDEYHFSPPLSYDTIGRWVEARGLMKTKEQRLQNIWLTRTKRFGSKGLSSEKLRKLSEWRKQLWANPDYKQRMSIAMSHPKNNLKIPEEKVTAIKERL